MVVKRGFVEIADGQVHYRHAGKKDSKRPLVMLHPGPTSSHAIVPLMERLAAHRWMVAPDLMGMGIRMARRKTTQTWGTSPKR